MGEVNQIIMQLLINNCEQNSLLVPFIFVGLLECDGLLFFHLGVSLTEIGRIGDGIKHGIHRKRCIQLYREPVHFALVQVNSSFLGSFLGSLSTFEACMF
mmetsp:Transcript_21954/g.32341  ORF Transcript_21954/g.32341 Transcript_21954/m.32341 type:complete len:100 (+) Transcript_21954:204-503(+)